MPIHLRPHSQTHPLPVEEEEYQELVRRNQGGWSRCADEKEWLAKLHYLRDGLKAGKLEQADFEARELRLVQNWLQPFLSSE